MADLLVSSRLFTEDVGALERMLSEHAGAGRGDEERINRQLLLVAVSARQILDYLKKEDSTDNSGKGRCGEYREETSGITPQKGPLTFYRACNAVIHAGRRPDYEFNSNDDAVVIAIHGTKKFRDRTTHTKAELHGMALVELCRMISSIDAQTRRGGEVAEAPSRAYEASPAQPTEERAMADKRDTYVYAFTLDNTTVELGITRDLHARQTELRGKYPDVYNFIEQVGFQPLTRAGAERKLRKMAAEGWPVNMETLKQP